MPEKANEEVSQLEAACSRAIESRRSLARELAGPNKSGAETDRQREKFVALQTFIDAVGRAILDEEKVAYAKTVGKVAIPPLNATPRPNPAQGGDPF